MKYLLCSGTKFKEVMLPYYIDTVGISSKIFPLIASLSQEDDRISFSEGTFRFAAQMIQRNNFRYTKNRYDIAPLKEYLKRGLPPTATLQYFIALVTHLSDTALATLTFKNWYQALSPVQKSVLLRSAIDRNEALFFWPDSPMRLFSGRSFPSGMRTITGGR